MKISKYKQNKLRKFAEHVGINSQSPAEIIDVMAISVVCEAPDMNCPAFPWCHKNSKIPDNQSAYEAAIYCRKQLLKWSKA